MAGPPASTVATAFGYAQELLTLCDTVLTATPQGTIDRQYISPGPPALDCATLCVWVTSFGDDAIASGDARRTGHQHIYGWLNLIGFSIIIVRDCVPVSGPQMGSAPLADDLTAAAETIVADVWAIWDEIPKAMEDDVLFGGRCSELYMDSAVALQTSGQLAGFQIDLRAAIRGISA